MDNLLFPEHEWDYVDKAVDRVKLAWLSHHHMNPDGKPMLLAFSGGKDSICLFFVCKRASEELGIPMEKMFHVQYNITTVDPPELVYFIRDLKKDYPFIELHHPKKTMWQLIEENGILPTMGTRYCCRVLKETSHVKGGFTLTGVRKSESPKRSGRTSFEIHDKKEIILLNDNDFDRREKEFCMQKNAHICNPIIDWSEDDVWHFIRGKNLPYCKLYDEGFDRLGCIGCPMKSREKRELDFQRWEGFKRKYLEACAKVCEKRGRGETAEELFDWWITGIFTDKSKQTETLFDLGA